MYEVLKKTAYRYMELNPISEVSFKRWLDCGFVQDVNGLYDFDFDKKYPDARMGSICCIMTILEAQEDGVVNLACNPMRDSEIYINNTLVLKTTYPDEAKPSVKQIPIRLSKGKNRLFIKCRKNRLGFGTSLGEVNIRWGTTLFYAPFAEYEGMLGFAYREPSMEDIDVESFPDMDEKKRDSITYAIAMVLFMVIIGIRYASK